jgi:hypothetical protein
LALLCTITKSFELSSTDPENVHRHYRIGTLHVHAPITNSSALVLRFQTNAMVGDPMQIHVAAPPAVREGSVWFKPMPTDLPQSAALSLTDGESGPAARISWTPQPNQTGTRIIPFAWWDGEFLHTRDARIEVGAATTIDNVLQGMVVGPGDDGAPLEGVTILVQKAAANGRRVTIVKAVTDAQGRFQSPGIPFRGAFTVVAELPGRQFVPVEITVRAGVNLPPVILSPIR